MTSYNRKSERILSVADVETTEIKHWQIPRTKFWGFYDGKTYRCFASSQAFARFLRQSQSRYLILHHANFDIIQLLVDGIQVVLLNSHNGKLILSSYAGHTFLNSFAVFPVSLGSIFAAFGYRKRSLDDLKRRNYDDCVLGLECFQKLDAAFEEITGISTIRKHTIAAASFAAAEKVAGRMPKCLQFEQAYRGGRVEVFDLREMKASCFDINSSYPFSIVDAPRESYLLHLEARTGDWHSPFFQASETERLIFPNGRFDTWIYQDVWEKYVEPYAQKTSVRVKHRFKVESLRWFEPIKPLILDVFDLKRKHKGDAIALACKLFLNSMYGRIGLRGERETARFTDNIPDGDDVLFYKVGRRFLCFKKTYVEPRSHFPLAAYITDNARGRLFQAIKRNGAAYCDTDSIYTPRKIFAGNKGDNIGQWKCEGRETFQATNVKDYVFGGEQVLKGGSHFLQWTLKQFASGSTAREINRERKTSLQKRIVLDNGETMPLITKP